MLYQSRMNFDEFLKVMRSALEDFETEAEEDFADDEEVDPDDMLALFNDMVSRRLDAEETEE